LDELLGLMGVLQWLVGQWVCDEELEAMGGDATGQDFD
jgi:hypothetical protein